jgi:hypothetical protein
MGLVAIVVPVYVYAKVLVPVPVNGLFIVFLENLCKMVGGLPSNVLDVKLSTQRVNNRGCQSCFQRLGVTLLCC